MSGCSWSGSGKYVHLCQTVFISHTIEWAAISTKKTCVKPKIPRTVRMNDDQRKLHVSPGADPACKSTPGLIEGFAFIEPQFTIGKAELWEIVVAYQEAESSVKYQQAATFCPGLYASQRWRSSRRPVREWRTNPTTLVDKRILGQMMSRLGLVAELVIHTRRYGVRTTVLRPSLLCALLFHAASHTLDPLYISFLFPTHFQLKFQ